MAAVEACYRPGWPLTGRATLPQAISDFRNASLFEGMPGMLLGLLDRDDAISEAVKQFGEDGRGPPNTGLSHAAGGTALKDRPDGPVVELPPADVAVVEEQAKDTVAAEAKRLLSFANGEHGHLLANDCSRAGSCCRTDGAALAGVEGYVDDRRADAVGWGSFDLSTVACPVTIVHGGSSTDCTRSCLAALLRAQPTCMRRLSCWAVCSSLTPPHVSSLTPGAACSSTCASR